MDAAAFQGYEPRQYGQPRFMLSNPSDTPDVIYRRAPSMSPHQMRVPPRRDRTPIQHHRRGTPRARSNSRTEMLLSYATEQLHVHQPLPPTSQAAVTVVPSQSAPTTPQVYPVPPSYAGHLEPMPASYGAPGGYFPATMHQADTEGMSNFAFQGQQQFDDYYLMSRSASSSVVIPDMSPHEGFIPHDTLHSAGEHPPMSTGLPSYPLVNVPLESSAGDATIVPSRPNPQCWDHGCNGRQFSTFSNLLRHQREKSGSAMKAICPYCGTEFTRTTARNGHMYGGKCRAKESSASASPEGSKSSQDGREA